MTYPLNPNDLKTLDLDKVSTLNNLEQLSFSQMYQIIENSSVKYNWAGKRNLVCGTIVKTLQTFPACKVSFEDLSKAIANKLNNYQITLMNTGKLSFLQKFDSSSRQELEKYKIEIALAKYTIEKLKVLDASSKEDIQKAGIITRIFFFITSTFRNIFNFNITKASKCIEDHENIIANKESILKPLSKYHKVSEIFNLTTGIMTATNIFLSIIGFKEIPYVSKTLHAATMITIFKNVIPQFLQAFNAI